MEYIRKPSWINAEVDFADEKQFVTVDREGWSVFRIIPEGLQLISQGYYRSHSVLKHGVTTSKDWFAAVLRDKTNHKLITVRVIHISSGRLLAEKSYRISFRWSKKRIITCMENGDIQIELPGITDHIQIKKLYTAK